MKFKSVSAKLNIVITGISLLLLIVAFFVLFEYNSKIEIDVYQNTKKQLINSAQDRIESKMRVGITNAISIANDERIKKALKTNKRELAINSLQDISAKMKKYTEFKNIKIHLHTKNNISFLRNWKLDKHDDDLSSFRAAVVSVNANQKPVTTFEPGRAGLLLRAITPIVDAQEEHVGSLEFIQGINSVVKAFDKNHQGFLLLMDESISNNIKTGKNFSFNDDVKFKNYIISQKYINKPFLADAKSIDMKKLFQSGYVLSSKYFYTYMEVKDFDNKKLGIVLLGKPLLTVNSVLDKAKTLIYLALFLILIMMIITTISIIIAVKKLIINPLKIFENALSDFFLFLQGKRDYTEHSLIDTDDEFGAMSKSLKENIAVSAKLHEEIGELNTNLEEKVEEKTKKVTTLLDNAGQGFLSFGSDFLIDEEYSIECIKFLGAKIAKVDITNLLFKDDNKKEFFKNTLIETFKIDDAVVRKSMLSLLPSEIILNKRALRLEYKIIDVDKLMLIITNISAQKKLEKKIKKEEETLKMIVEVVSESDAFYDTKKDYEEFITSYEELIDPNKTSLHNLSEVYRTIHTFKGAFSQLYMNNVVRFLHSLESELSSMIKENKHTNEMLIALLRKSDFETNLESELSTIKDILGEEFINSQSFIKVIYSEIKVLQDKVYSMFEKEHLETKQAKEIIQRVTSLSNHKLMTLLKHYPSLVEQLALRLGKEVYDLEIIGSDDIVVIDEYKPFIKSLVHIFRNSIDHGIETPEERLENGKEERGTISCSFEVENDAIEIIISDDGAGLNKDKILQKALKENIISVQEATLMSDEDMYGLIFNDRFSTKDEISDISGRGVGMSAVKHELDKLGGSIKINTQKNSGTTFIFTIPKQKGEI